jgi:hypothetical protein
MTPQQLAQERARREAAERQEARNKKLDAMAERRLRLSEESRASTEFWRKKQWDMSVRRESRLSQPKAGNGQDMTKRLGEIERNLMLAMQDRAEARAAGFQDGDPKKKVVDVDFAEAYQQAQVLIDQLNAEKQFIRNQGSARADANDPTAKDNANVYRNAKPGQTINGMTKVRGDIYTSGGDTYYQHTSGNRWRPLPPGELPPDLRRKVEARNAAVAAERARREQRGGRPQPSP